MPVHLVCKENTYFFKLNFKFQAIQAQKTEIKKITKKSKHKVTAPSTMNDGVKGQTIFPRGSKIFYSDTRVLGSGTLRPS